MSIMYACTNDGILSLPVASTFSAGRQGAPVGRLRCDDRSRVHALRRQPGHAVRARAGLQAVDFFEFAQVDDSDGIGSGESHVGATLVRRNENAAGPSDPDACLHGSSAGVENDQTAAAAAKLGHQYQLTVWREFQAVRARAPASIVWTTFLVATSMTEIRPSPE